MANGQGATASRLQTQIDQKKTELAAIAPQVQQYSALLDRKNGALTQLNQAQQSLQQAQGQLQAADPKQVVTVGKVHSVSVITNVVQKGAVAVFAGLFLALGIVTALELLARSRQPAELEVPSGWAQPVQPASGQDPFPSRV
jgi:hypothetical protein